MAVLKDINFKISNSWIDLGNLAYPIGSIFQSTSSASPATLFGGTWTQIKDTFLLGAGDNYAADDTGGESEHILTVSEIPSHGHGVQVCWVGDGSSWIDKGRITYRDSGKTNNMTNWYTMPNGGNSSHNNMPPYVAVYTWKRTA